MAAIVSPCYTGARCLAVRTGHSAISFRQRRSGGEYEHEEDCGAGRGGRDGCRCAGAAGCADQDRHRRTGHDYGQRRGHRPRQPHRDPEGPQGQLRHDRRPRQRGAVRFDQGGRQAHRDVLREHGAERAEAGREAQGHRRGGRDEERFDEAWRDRLQAADDHRRDHGDRHEGAVDLVQGTERLGVQLEGRGQGRAVEGEGR